MTVNDDDDEPNSQPSETMSQNSEDTNIGFLPSRKWLACSVVLFVDTFPAFF
jgi:hypothetical protein